MPDTNSPKVTMADPDMRPMLFGARNDHPSRSWTCPDDRTMAAYHDGVLGSRERARVHFHLAKCERCRVLVADLVKAEREADLPTPSPGLVAKAIQFASTRSTRSRWMWVPAGAGVTVVLLASAAVLLRKPEQLAITLPPTPSAPMIAKSKPSATPRAPVQEILRKSATADRLPTIVFPRPDRVVARERLQFRWKPVSQSSYYDVRVVSPEGDLVWQGQTRASALHLPKDVVLSDGPYFVWITAYLADGRTAKSSPVPFQLKR